MLSQDFEFLYLKSKTFLLFDSINIYIVFIPFLPNEKQLF